MPAVFRELKNGRMENWHILETSTAYCLQTQKSVTLLREFDIGQPLPFFFYFYTYDSRYCLMSTETQRKHVQYRHSQKQIQQQECSFSSSFTSGKLLTMDLNCVLLIFLMFLYKCKCRQQLWVAPLISRDSMKISSLHDAVVNQEG